MSSASAVLRRLRIAGVIARLLAPAPAARRDRGPIAAVADRTNLMAAPTSDNLQRLALLLQAGTLKVHIQQTYPLDQAAAAMNALAKTHTRGELALHVA